MNEETIGGWLDELASSAPAPGGGAAGALEVAVGAALVEMVCNLTIGKPAFAEHEGTMTEARDRATTVRHQAVGLAAEDAEAFAGDRRVSPAKTGGTRRGRRHRGSRRRSLPPPTCLGGRPPPRSSASPSARPRRQRQRRLRRCGRCGGRPRGAPGGAREHRRQPGLDRRPRSSGGARRGSGRDRARSRPCRRRGRRGPRADGRMTLLDGRELAASIRAQAADEAASLAPVLAAVVATDDPATAWYVGSIAKAAAATGIELRESRLGDYDRSGVLSVSTSSADPSVDAIICLTPLPGGLTLAEAASGSPRRRTSTRRAPQLGRLSGLPASRRRQRRRWSCCTTRERRRGSRGSRSGPPRPSSASRSPCCCSPSTPRSRSATLPLATSRRSRAVPASRGGGRASAPDRGRPRRARSRRDRRRHE